MQDLVHPAGLTQGRRRLQPGARETGATQGEHAVLIRAIRPGDKERLLRTYSRLSLETIYRRFHTPYPKVPERLVVSFTKADRYRMGGVVAVVGDEIVGHAMYVRLEDSVSEAEFAIVVEDRWQSKGVGKLLLFKLVEEAKHQGIEIFTGLVLRENQSMLGLIDAVFAGAKRRLRDDLYYVCAPLRSLKPIAILEPSGSTRLSA